MHGTFLIKCTRISRRKIDMSPSLPPHNKYKSFHSYMFETILNKLGWERVFLHARCTGLDAIIHWCHVRIGRHTVRLKRYLVARIWTQSSSNVVFDPDLVRKRPPQSETVQNRKRRNVQTPLPRRIGLLWGLIGWKVGLITLHWNCMKPDRTYNYYIMGTSRLKSDGGFIASS